MRRFVTLMIGTAALLTTGTAIAAPATPAGPNAAAQAYRQAIRRECQRGVFSQSDLHRLYGAARASGDHGYLPRPTVAQDACEQAP